MRKLSLLVFFIPAIVLSVMVWNDYTDDLQGNEDPYSSIAGMFYLDEGEEVVVLSKTQDFTWARLGVFDAQTGAILKDVMVQAEMQGVIPAVVYQDQGIIIPTYSDGSGLQLNHVSNSGEVKELAQSTLHVPGSLSSNVAAWRGHILITGETIGSAYYVAEIQNGMKKFALLNTDLLPSDPIRASFVGSSLNNEQGVPLLEVDLQNGQTALVSGILDEDERPEVKIQSEEQGTFDARDEAGLQFAKPFGIDVSRLIRIDGAKGNQARFYNAQSEEWGELVPTPKPLYRAKVVLLNDEEVLIAGTDTENGQEQLAGYVYNEKNGSFTDASALVSRLTYKDFASSDGEFYKESGSDSLYYSDMESAAGWMNISNGQAGWIDSNTLANWREAAMTQRISLSTFMAYVREGGALIINWMAWLLIPTLMFLVPAIAGPLLRQKHSRNLKEGRLVTGTIASMQETGVYVNNLPQVKFVVQFVEAGQHKQVEIKKVISLVNVPRQGDDVLISYNPRNNKAMFVTEEDVNVESDPPQTIPDALLDRIEYREPFRRGQALVLHFATREEDYPVPVIQPPGFEYRTGRRANLIVSDGVARIRSYDGTGREEEAQLALEAEVVSVEKANLEIEGRQLLVMDLLVSRGDDRLRKSNSLFVPERYAVQTGIRIPMQMGEQDFERELRLSKGKQGAAIVRTVTYEGHTVGERPVARIDVEREGKLYRIRQSIEPVHGVQVGDEIWIAYDANSQEAMIVNYAS